ncbi:disease resistance protein RPV1-like isoform X2 [Apium graveolens]|uniref:disease resistance protein RPV1-like isoform X2 n=1 Tax=Apium graveolens TaxID=4045 RepID=UPI003D7B27E1
MLKLKSLESSAPEYRYDVFLSFSGEDTRKTFTDHLYTALLHEGLITFRDDEEIERGECIKSELENGILQSRSWIIVLSKKYAFSSWCLDELSMILECRNKSKRLVLPIFYHVDPSDVRKQSGCISEALDYHEEKFKRETDETKRKILMDKIKRWRIALTELANLGGMPLQNVANGYESKLIEKIVNVVKDKVTCYPLSVTQHPIGIGRSVQDISFWLRNCSNNVEVFALYGVGGLGKTTIAKCVYNMNFQLFEGGSFLENIREYSERPDGLVCLQRQLLSDISKGKAPTIKNLNDGILKIKSALLHRKLLIVLDDVDQVEQLDAIFGMREWFHQGSKIIITTRNVHLLEAYEHCTRYAIETLNSDDSLELFSWHAFRDSRPPECYMEHSKRIIKQCEGLPLALKVLGASLRGKNVDVWRSAIGKLEIIPHYKIQKILRVSYDSLQDDLDKDLFLEIACFFSGEAKSFVVRVLDECGYYTLIGIENLIDRCLLTIDTNENLRMHYLVQSMGREIIRQQLPRDPGQRSRLWYWKDSLEVLKDETGTRAIEGLAMEMSTINACRAEVRTKAFSPMQKLRILKLNNVQLSGGYKDFPRNLKWLCWHKYTLRSLPNDFPSSSLVAIDMQNSKLQILGEGNKSFGSLKSLNLSHCHDIVRTPDFANCFALEELILEHCANLVEIDESIGVAEGLALINLKDCSLLKKLPERLCMLKLLETLNISGCSSLGMFPAEMRKMESLKVFHADGLDFSNSNNKTQQNESWREFIRGLVSKPKISSQLSLNSLPCYSITRLSLRNCNLHDSSFPKDFRVAPSLEFLNLSNNPICFLPDCFKVLKEVKILVLSECNQLQTIEDLPIIEDLELLNCPLLEKITMRRGLSIRGYCHPWDCVKLLEMDGVFKIVPIGEIDSELINDCGIFNVESMKTIQIRLYNIYTHANIKCPIQGIYESQRSGNIFTMFYPGGSVPTWFTSQSYGPSLSFIVSRSNLRYINTCVVYKLKPGRGRYFYLIFHNITKDKMIAYHPSCYGIPEGDEYMTWLSHWKFGSHEMGPGDEVNVSIFNCNDNHSFEMKEIGICLVYEEKEQAGFHLAKRQKIQQTCEEISQFVIPVERQPARHHGTTQIYFTGCGVTTLDYWMEKYFGKYATVEKGYNYSI